MLLSTLAKIDISIFSQWTVICWRYILNSCLWVLWYNGKWKKRTGLLALWCGYAMPTAWRLKPCRNDRIGARQAVYLTPSRWGYVKTNYCVDYGRWYGFWVFELLWEYDVWDSGFGWSGIAGYSLFPLLFDAAVYAFSRGDYDGAVQFSELRQVRLFESERKDVWQFVTGCEVCYVCCGQVAVEQR